MSCYRIVLAEKAGTPVSVACELLGVSTSGFYAWASRAPADRAPTDAWLIEKIKRVHAENRGVYGSRRVAAELRLGEGVTVSASGCSGSRVARGERRGAAGCGGRRAAVVAGAAARGRHEPGDALWALSRTIGVLVGPHAWQPEAVGRVDVMATLLELTTAAVLAPLVGWARRGPALLGATALVLVVGTGATVFALAPAGAISAGHDHGLPDTPLRVAAPSPTGEFTVAEARRARRCATRAMPGASVAGPARTRVTLVARDFCFDRQAFAIPAGRSIVVRVVNDERRGGPSRTHALSIYAFSTVPARRHPVLIGDPVPAGDGREQRFRAPAPGSYFFQWWQERYSGPPAVRSARPATGSTSVSDAACVEHAERRDEHSA